MISFSGLQQLAVILSQNRLNFMPSLPRSASPKTKMDRLYLGLINREFDDDAQAAGEIYQKTANSPAYQALKSRLHSRMINSVLIIDTDQPHYSEFQRAYYEVFKNLAAVKTLLGRYARQPAIELAEQTLKTALRFEFTDVVLELARQLRFHHGTVTGNRKRFHKYNNMVMQYSEILTAELKAEEFYADLAVEFVNSRSSQLELVKKAEEYSQELRVLTGKYHSYRLNYVAFTLFAIRYEIANDYPNTLAVCREAMAYFEEKKHLASLSAIFSFRIKALACYIQLREFEKAGAAAEECLQIAPAGSRNWYLTLDYYMILSFHSENYRKAFDIYQSAVKHPGFRQQQKNVTEHWQVYEAFIHYFISIGKIQPISGGPAKKFRLRRFLNSAPTYSKDKRGANISILILHVLFLLREKKYGEIIDRMEALQTYTHRYLRRDDTFRSNCFIKMLLTLPAASFHKKAVLRKAKKYWDNLRSVPLHAANQNAELEIVPYETLWECALESLDEKFH
jgi:tetratricopeptide (TPR) repeat protein